MEYYFETNLGLLIIASRHDLPTAVDLCVAGKVWATYLSADIAAAAVAARTTGHAQLDALPLTILPLNLSSWKQSLPLYFSAATLLPESAGKPLPAIESSRPLQPEPQFAS
jgi:hypothetical protein